MLCLAFSKLKTLVHINLSGFTNRILPSGTDSIQGWIIFLNLYNNFYKLGTLQGFSCILVSYIFFSDDV